ncbi:MAG: hypothetical protein R3C53_21580 [Pirellulaceae bacterium]
MTRITEPAGTSPKTVLTQDAQALNLTPLAIYGNMTLELPS